MSIQAIDLTDVNVDRSKSFGMLTVIDETWDLTHLDPFGFQFELEPHFFVSVIVFFSCHCFTRGFSRDTRPRSQIPKAEIYDDGREQRIFCRTRYELSRRLLRDLILTLPTRRIILADERQPNFLTVEATNEQGATSTYAVFFEVLKSNTRKFRLILQVQSAYVLDGGLTKRQKLAKKVSLKNILLAAMEGRRIRP